MINLNHLSSICIILIISSCLITVSQSSEAGNWLTKSLDYFSLEKCSPLDKSGITGDFYACLNSPVDSSSTSTASSPSSPTMGQSKSGFGDWNKFGSNGGGKVDGFASSSGFSGGSGSFNSFGSGQSASSTSADSWPLSLVNDLRQMINCFPKLVKPCMTVSEVQFFDTIRSFFQAQVNYASPNASSIAAEISSSGCVKGNSMDTNTICYSTNIHKQNWFGWKINWSDGQMCRFIDDISKCETSSFDKCSSSVRRFAVGLWESGLKVTPCLDGVTTLSSPSPVSANPVDQTKSLAPGLSVNPNQTPSRLTNDANINSNDYSSSNLTVNNPTVNSIEPEITSNQEDPVQSISKVSERPHPRFFDYMDGNSAFNGFDRDQRWNINNENEEDRYNEFDGKMKHSKLVKLHEVEGEGESRHEHNKKHHNVEEEQWSRIKEEFKRKMRESLESQESNESEYEEGSEESDEYKNLDIHDDRKKHFGPRLRNQEDEYQDARNDRENSRNFFGINRQNRREEELKRERKRNEDELRRRQEDEERRTELMKANSRRLQEVESQRREREERMREEEERRREAEDRRREVKQRKDNEMRMERERENARKGRGERRGWQDEEIARSERYLGKAHSINRWDHINGQNENNGINVDQTESNVRDCIESTINSWSSLAENHNSNDLMDLMCRNMESIHSCLNKHPEIKSNGQANRLGHLKFLYSALCDSKNNKTIDRVKQCLADHSPSSSGSFLQTKYPNGASSRFWH